MTTDTPARSRHRAGAMLRLPEVLARTGLARASIYRFIAANKFPPPVKLGERASAWPEHEVTAWCEARISARDAKAAAA